MDTFENILFKSHFWRVLKSLSRIPEPQFFPFDIIWLFKILPKHSLLVGTKLENDVTHKHSSSWRHASRGIWRTLFFCMILMMGFDRFSFMMPPRQLIGRWRSLEKIKTVARNENWWCLQRIYQYIFWWLTS